MFHDPENQRKAIDGRVRGWGTIEIGRSGTRAGHVVQVDHLTSGIQWRHLLERAFDLAGRSTPVRPHDAGWWVGVICAAALEAGHSPAARRPGEMIGSDKHVVMVLEPERMVEPVPAWPLVRLTPDGKWLDLRGETCCAHGPADAELRAYAALMGEYEPDLGALREMFDLGVLQWSRPHEQTGRRTVVHAHSSRSRSARR